MDCSGVCFCHSVVDPLQEHTGNMVVGKTKENNDMSATTPFEAPKAEPASNAEKDPQNWTTGDERMTGAQDSYLKTLSEEADEPDAYDTRLTKAEASERIDALQAETGRGR